MHSIWRIAIALCFTGMAAVAMADDTTPAAAPAASGTAAAADATPPAPPAPPPPPPWKANAELGYIKTSGGGTSTQSFHGKLHGEYVDGDWSHEGNILALSTSSNAVDAASTEQYTVGTKSKRSFTPLNYLFIQSEWDKDIPGPLDYQAFVSTGYGRYLLKSDAQDLSMEIGAGFRHDQANPAPLPPPPPAVPPAVVESHNSGIANFNAAYRLAISSTVTFTEKVDVQYGKDSTVGHSVTELKQAVTKALAFTLNYDYRRTTATAAPVQTSSITTINLIYQFQ